MPRTVKPAPGRVRAPKVGLVLGAGGVLGGAWLTGALCAIAAESGWDPGSADYIVGTSAGSMVGAMLACGVPPWYAIARDAGEVAGVPGDTRADGATRTSAYAFHRGAPWLGPGSWRLALSSLARPHRHSPASLLAGWLPPGPFSTEPLKETVRRVQSGSWAPHPNFWAVAVDYRDGGRVAFGRGGAPKARLPEAVAASCAIPGFFRAVEIQGRRYVDGGLISPSNLDILAGEGLDLVVALNPMSSLHRGASDTLPERVVARVRRNTGRRLGSEARRLREAGAEVILLQPVAHDLEVMGANLMNPSRRARVLEVATTTTRRHLREAGVGMRLSQLPPGLPQLVRRPAAGGTEPLDFAALARARWNDRPARGGRTLSLS